MNPSVAKLEAWYDENRNQYEQFASKTTNLLQTILHEEGIPFHSITHRLKTVSSCLDKCNRKNYDDPAKKIMDLAGVRIIAYTTSDVESICRIITREFSVDESNSGNKAELLNSDRVGYLSVHYVASLSQERAALLEYRKFSDMFCEIQVRTLLQHAWAEIEHDRSYKFSGVLPKSIQRRFHLLAGVLEMVDSEFQRLSDEIDVYVHQIQIQTKEGGLNIPLDTTSLIAFLSQKILNVNIAKSFCNCDNIIIEELHNWGIDSLEKLSDILPQAFCTAYEVYATNRSTSNYLGLLRDAMICADIERYFTASWNMHWSVYDIDTLNFWKACGVDVSILDNHVQLEEYL